MSQEYITDETIPFEQLSLEIQGKMEHLHIPGVAAGILNGEETYAAGFGVTNVENPLPVTPSTLFQIGSITKTITCLAAMRLIEQGKLELDKPVRHYLPGLRLADESVAGSVTLRHLLTHTAGWLGDYFDDSGPGDDALERIVERMVRLPQFTLLGELFSYNNAGFYLAGRLVEIAAGKSYEAAVKELVLDPLCMQRSFFFAQDAITYRTSSGHEAVFTPQPETPKVARPWGLTRCGNALGGLNSTVEDMLRYARFQMGDGTAPGGSRLLSPASMNEMHTPRVPAGLGEVLALSWFTRQVDGVTIIRHGGATNGQMATLQIIPSRRFAVVFLTNSDRGDELYTPLVRWTLEHFLNLLEQEPLPIPATPAELDPYCGLYRAPASDIQLSMKGDQLWMQQNPKGGFPTVDSPAPPLPPAIRMGLCGTDQLVILDEPGRGEAGMFLRDANGEIVWFRFGGRLHRKDGTSPEFIHD